MAQRDHVLYRDDFTGHRIYSATAGSNVGHNWVIADTSSAGTPTYAPVDDATDGFMGGVALDFDSQAEAQNVCLYHADLLWADIDLLTEVNFLVKMNQAAIDATTSVAFGLASERNDAIDSIAEAALFRLVGSASTTAVVVETDDGTNNNDDVATGKTLINAYKRFTINFAAGTNDVRFFINGEPVATSTTFDMSNYTSCLQPFVQIQKTSDANTDGLTLAQVEVRGRYPLF